MKGGHLQEVLNTVDLENFGILENWLLRRCGCLREMVATEVPLYYSQNRSSVPLTSGLIISLIIANLISGIISTIWLLDE